MAYSDFTTLRKVNQLLGVSHQLKALFDGAIPSITPSEHLLFDLAEAEILAPVTEKSKSELIIAPVLREVRRNNSQRVSYFSGFNFDVAPEKQLTGICDFIFGTAPQTLEISAPILCVIEVTGGVPQNRTLEEGFGQCAAEMYAAQLYNEQENTKATPIYGSVTNGYEWAFMVLENTDLKIDTDRYTILKLSELLGVFQLLIS